MALWGSRGSAGAHGRWGVVAQPCPRRQPFPGRSTGLSRSSTPGTRLTRRCRGDSAAAGAGPLPQARCPLSTWPPRPLPKWPSRRRARAVKLRAGRSMAAAGPGISMAAGAARARRQEDAPGCLLLPEGRGQGQLRGGEPGAAPPGPQAGSEGLGRGVRARLGVRGMAELGWGCCGVWLGCDRHPAVAWLWLVALSHPGHDQGRGILSGWGCDHHQVLAAAT